MPSSTSANPFSQDISAPGRRSRRVALYYDNHLILATAIGEIRPSGKMVR